MGVDASYYVALEHGRKVPGPNALNKIATALGVECPAVFAAYQQTVLSARRVSRQKRARIARKGR